ncbi:copper resistance CopC/CopD family protein [Fictibacillus terranigra]|uniref:Copper resistance protein CopC n=1 Tax=Fictibacillus terranigra TaxID=3058424 RepID=A0ABT8E2D3_9BACL|nr:copper resistance protein CopC [Fictibacillus sp. CENA-BCM004]MDN4072080.1 copper resistance protein CopC [Fictibacillus sp. CENA-BCM004]
MDRTGVELLKVFILLVSAWLLFLPQQADAHAFLVQSHPSEESSLGTMPPSVKLTFNERLEKELYSLKILDDRGDVITKEPRMSKDQRSLSVSVPSQKKGVYTVQYSVISADGHPVNGAYLFTVGNTASKGSTPALPAGESGNHEENVYNPASWLVRTLYYIALLLASGWVLWKSFIPFTRSEQKEDYIKRGRQLQRIHLLLLAGFIGIQASGLLNGSTWNKLPDLLIHSAVGWSWMLSLAVAAAGLFLTWRRAWFDITWAALLLLAKSLNGHAAGQEMAAAAVGLDVLHLLFASVWAGGLCYLYQSSRKNQSDAAAFISRFSAAALVSLCVLIVTGVPYSLLLLPRISYIWDTAWGIFLSLKAVAVVLILITGAFLRFYLNKRNGQASVSTLLKIDLSLMAAVLIIVAVFTQLSPNPENEALNWKERKNGVRLEIHTSVLQPGANRFNVKTVTKKGEPVIEKAELQFQSLDQPSVPKIIVPLKREKGSDSRHSSYGKTGAYPPFPGKWRITIRVIDADVDEISVSKDIKIYKLQP